MKAKWLPDKIVFAKNMTLDDVEEMVLEILISQFSIPLTFKGKPVYLKKFNELSRESRTFDHLVRRSGIGKQRLYDSRRCMRIHWIPVVIRNYMNPEVFIKYDYSDKKKCGLFYFFLENERYLVILEDHDDYYNVETAYYIDDQNIFNYYVSEKRKNATM